MSWTVERVQTLRRLWAKGVPASQIGKDLGCTRNAVIGKVHRLQLKARLDHDDINKARDRRIKEALAVLEQGGCLSDLAIQWGIARPRVTQWCKQYLSVDHYHALAENGRATAGKRKRDFHLGYRLELIDLCQQNGWGLEKVAHAIGVSYPALYSLLKRHAADGLTQAVEDFREEEAA